MPSVRAMRLASLDMLHAKEELARGFNALGAGDEAREGAEQELPVSSGSSELP